jgi:DNA (cytosine-5)-methyltransferase 1
MPSPSSKPPQIAAVDLFCGAGGKTHGFLTEKIPVVAGVDTDPSCAFAFEANNKGAKFHRKSVDDLTPKEVSSWYSKGATHVLIGCAPCQPFSTYSYRYRDTGRRRRSDSRWGLLGSFSDLIQGVLPEIVAAENVPALALQGHRVYLDFISDLESLGYKVTSKVVKCADYGVPQTRERLVVLASLLGSISLVEPTHSPETYVTVRQQIGELPPLVAGGEPPPGDPLHRSSRLSPINLRRIRKTPEGGGWQDWPPSLRLACHKKESGKTYPSVYGCMRWNELAPNALRGA